MLAFVLLLPLKAQDVFLSNEAVASEQSNDDALERDIEKGTCSGTEPLPITERCYAAQVPTTSLKVALRWTGSGQLDAVLRGPVTLTIPGLAVEQIGPILSFGLLGELVDGLLQFSDAFYCSDQDWLQLRVALPFPMTLVLTTCDCSEVETLQSEVPSVHPEAELPWSLNPNAPCVGEGDFPFTPVCYAASAVVESFTVALQRYADGQGQLDLVASGAVPGRLISGNFTKEGQSLQLLELERTFNGQIEISSLKYCAMPDQIRMTLTKPLAITLVLTRSDRCWGMRPELAFAAEPAIETFADPASVPITNATGTLGRGSCDTDTYGTCSVTNCHWSRGATQCMFGKCVCQPGWCAMNGACFPTREAMSVETGGTCSVFPCSGSRGKVECYQGRCVCQIGSYSSNGKCYRVTDTGGSCKLFNCRASRGPADCIANNCVCKAGYVAIDGRCVKTNF